MNCENQPCPHDALPGCIWCRWCIDALAEERHQEDKKRWAREAEEKLRQAELSEKEEEEVPDE